MKQKTINTLSIIIGLLGITIALILFFINKKESAISYDIEKPSYTIFDNESISIDGFSIFLNDTTLVKENIYLTTLSIWNSGDLSIKKSDIRSNSDSLYIRVSGISRLLSIEKIKEVKHNVSNISLEAKVDSLFSIDWKYFDSKDGVKYQFIYMGDDELSVSFEGKIVNTNIKVFTKPNSKSKTFYKYLFSFLLFAAGMAFYTYYETKSFSYKIDNIRGKKPNPKKPSRLLYFGGIILLFGGTVLLVFEMVLSEKQVPF